jgi:hypothetical protein
MVVQSTVWDESSRVLAVVTATLLVLEHSSTGASLP